MEFRWINCFFWFEGIKSHRLVNCLPRLWICIFKEIIGVLFEFVLKGGIHAFQFVSCQWEFVLHLRRVKSALRQSWAVAARVIDTKVGCIGFRVWLERWAPTDIQIVSFGENVNWILGHLLQRRDRRDILRNVRLTWDIVDWFLLGERPEFAHLHLLVGAVAIVVHIAVVLVSDLAWHDAWKLRGRSLFRVSNQHVWDPCLQYWEAWAFAFILGYPRLVPGDNGSCWRFILHWRIFVEFKRVEYCGRLNQVVIRWGAERSIDQKLLQLHFFLGWVDSLSGHWLWLNYGVVGFFGLLVFTVALGHLQSDK